MFLAITKHGGGSDRSLKGLDSIFMKMNDATVSCDMKREGIASVSRCILVSGKKKKKSFQKAPMEIKFCVSTSGQNFQDAANSLNSQISF